MGHSFFTVESGIHHFLTLKKGESLITKANLRRDGWCIFRWKV